MIEKTSCFYCNLEFGAPDQNIFGYGLHPKCFLEWFQLGSPEEFISLVRRSASGKGSRSATGGWNTSFFQGRYRKYSAILGGVSYILKVREEEAPELPDVEYLCNQVARHLKIPNPDFYLIDFLGMRTFATKNFIKPGVSARDLKHIYHYIKKGEENYNCENLVRTILDVTGRVNDVETFVNVCLYDSFIGNHDRHGRNLGFIVTPKNSRLAPIYDNNSMLGLESGNMLNAQWNPDGKIATKFAVKPTAKHYVEEFIILGYADVVNKFVERISIAKCESLVDRSTCSQLMKDALKKLFSCRYQEMKDALEKKS